jgi:tRNA threonylcarbamoyladenosine biosynthesis protein TsaB
MRGPLLAIDCSAAACSVALWREGAIVAHRFEAMERGQAEALMPMLAQVMATAALGWEALGAVAVGVGPGSFTGLRVALAAARGIGLAAGIPVHGVSTLAALVEAVPEARRRGRTLAAFIASKRGDLYGQWFDAALRPLNEPGVLAPAAAAALPSGPVLLAGDGAGAVLAHLTTRSAEIVLAPGSGLPDAAAVAHHAARVGFDKLLPPLPLYLHAPAVTIAPDPARVEEAGEPDVAGLARVHAASFAEAWSAASIAGLLATPGTFALLARQDGEAVGFILVRAAADEAEILSLGVVPAWRRRGIARRLLDAALARLVGVEALFLEVEADNAPALALYLGAAFAPVGRRPSYYPSQGQARDALLLRRIVTSN